MVTGLAGRLYLSGRLDGMTDDQLQLVAEGVELAQRWDDAALGSVPTWPLGLPSWDDDWVAVGRATPDETLLAVWWRGAGDPEVEIDVPDGDVEAVYPRDDAAGLALGVEKDRVRLRARGGGPAARLLRIRRRSTR
jgi:alpha-galactosidase